MRSTVARVTAALLVTLALVVGATPVTAQSSDQPAWADDLFADLQEMQPRYNANVSETDMNFAQRQVYNQLTGNTINVYFVGTDVVFSFRMRSDGRITDLQQSRRENADLKMLLTRETAESLAAKDDPVPPFVDAVQNGKMRDGSVKGIVIRGEDGKPVKQATWTVVNTLKGLF